MAFQDILVPVDFKSGSRIALERARDNLEAAEGRIVVLHVIDEQTLDQVLALMPENEESSLRDRLRQQAHEQLTQLIAGIDT